MIKIGFWARNHEDNPTLPRAQDHVDTSWDSQERKLIALYLKTGKESAAYRGMSICRFCDRWNGSRDFTDDVYLWPEGFAHYIEEHGVKPPQEFVEHVLKKLQSGVTGAMSTIEKMEQFRNQLVEHYNKNKRRR